MGHTSLSAKPPPTRQLPSHPSPSPHIREQKRKKSLTTLDQRSKKSSTLQNQFQSQFQRMLSERPTTTSGAATSPHGASPRRPHTRSPQPPGPQRHSRPSTSADTC